MTPPSHLLPPMAVEAHYLHLSASPQILIDRELLVSRVKDNHQAAFAAADTGFMMPYGDGGFAGTSGIAGSKKRPTETPVSFYGEVPLTNFQQDLLHDRLLILQTQRAEAAFTDRKRQFAIKFAAAIENEVKNRLKAMDEEMEAAKKLNWALEARVQSLNVENQIWRELAQSNEAAANLLRADLEEAITTNICIDEDQRQFIGYDNIADDRESCCGDSEDCNKMFSPPSATMRICRSCRRNEPTVLLLPCRHLCLCAACGPAADSCPICNCFTSGTVHVNLS